MTKPAARDADVPEPAASAGFAGLGLAETLMKVVTALGYEEPTAVQRQTIPAMLEGGDLLVQAATGTGKTAAFALPIIQRLSQGVEDAAPAPEGDAPRVVVSRAVARSKGKHATRALVLVPTRELAIQVAEAVHRYARGTGLAVVPVYGGASMPLQMRALHRGADIVVATPGRALDHLRRATLSLESLLVLVLDEADEMLDMGFAEELDEILQATPKERQTTLFSATMPARIESIARKHLRDARHVTVAGEKTAAGKLPRVRQIAYVVRRDQKADVLGRVLDLECPESAIVFCRTRIEVDMLVESLNSRGFRAEALHGGFQQRQRDAVMARFRAAKADLLIATDVAARGLDIKQLSHVVNFDLPASADAYVHRIGRTGRAGREGTAITLVEPREARHLRSIELLTRQKIEVAPIPSVADLRARRLAATREALRERLVAGKLDEVRVVVESLAEEFDLLDVAAAAVQLAHAATAGDREDEEKELEAPFVPGAGRAAGREGGAMGGHAGGHAAKRGPERADGQARSDAVAPRSPHVRVAPGRREHADDEDRGAPHGGQSKRPLRGASTGEFGPTCNLKITAGRLDGIRPADLVGAIAGETGVPPREVGAIKIADRFSLVEVPEARADEIIAALKKTKLRGKPVKVRRGRDG